jgi:hypothetical protein
MEDIMKNTLSLLMVGLLLAGGVGCSSAPKNNEDAETEAMLAAEELEEVTETEETADEVPTETASTTTTPAPAPTSDLSLGAGSSGRGH